jgi:hypothetical protein
MPVSTEKAPPATPAEPAQPAQPAEPAAKKPRGEAAKSLASFKEAVSDDIPF